ncbi:hypothetical protein DPMN_112095 [Dreissena polymorpha]|uniref:Uncharacterized protein n=1 Tax=Dreissena polymorpha TaxID=45954 RepID=A0A9D4KFV4_DREPO|nr:hypothetical protein DPMN_112095 [Dreissena polymorpha]
MLEKASNRLQCILSSRAHVNSLPHTTKDPEAVHGVQYSQICARKENGSVSSGKWQCVEDIDKQFEN